MVPMKLSEIKKKLLHGIFTMTYSAKYASVRMRTLSDCCSNNLAQSRKRQNRMSRLNIFPHCHLDKRILRVNIWKADAFECSRKSAGWINWLIVTFSANDNNNGY